MGGEIQENNGTVMLVEDIFEETAAKQEAQHLLVKPVLKDNVVEP